jgi:hypothetical protein
MRRMRRNGGLRPLLLPFTALLSVATVSLRSADRNLVSDTRLSSSRLHRLAISALDVRALDAAPRRGRARVPVRRALPPRRPRLRLALLLLLCAHAAARRRNTVPGLRRGVGRAAPWRGRRRPAPALRADARVPRDGRGRAAAHAVRGGAARGRGRGADNPPFQPAAPRRLERPAGDRAEHPLPRQMGTRAPVRGPPVAPRRGDRCVGASASSFFVVLAA